MKDFIIDQNSNLLIEDGDWLLGDSHHQHIELLLTSLPGQWKENPEAGAGLALSQNGVADSFHQAHDCYTTRSRRIQTR